mmetsp:Transcript_5649/g.8915  ORF Transcript_5649/g.8915 Transcript_5649/m.8915 type:complete len:230 (+) Transcript_5649:214-903(+)|eukprot:CAMPEP_0178759706 /NCGR_PEP_ID=MMETSP0744-20121128/15089_1 /TAXON_ID=913974 /ORGANISM="Nitzschia punctata, Strain CCMP561" /LENGTH=229 /DNA_ID=CAMNT_0020414209 /DNA_START=223 /DNA_END=912 /DNA_ORIENTATION=+
MGSVIGKESVAEPSYRCLFQRSSQAQTPYEVREYGKRFVAEVCYSDSENTGTPFRMLADYIGVFGKPHNEGQESMAMTAPVVIDQRQGTQISMTAPVVTENATPEGGEKRMKFFLPAEYDNMSKIPTPSNPSVKIAEVPPAIGAVHRYSGSMSEKINEERALALAAQLRKDGVERLTDAIAKQHFQFWGFNPPFTIPMFRRNEVWLELSHEEVKLLQRKFEPSGNEATS